MPRCARSWIFVGLLMALLTGGCVIQPIAQPATQPREALNHGYAQLHWVANKLQHIDKLLLIKRESEAVESAVDAVAQTMRRHANTLEQMERDLAAVDLSEDGLPVYEQKKRWAVVRERGLVTGTPVLGQTGIEFERTLLLSLTAVLNQQRHLLSVMRSDEPEPALRDWLLATEEELNALYERLTGLLADAYFCDSRGCSG